MKKLTLKIVNTLFTNDTFILLDGEEMHAKKNSFGNNVITYETDNDEVELNIFTLHELEGKHWLAMFLLFYVISFFGIFNARYQKIPISLNYKGKIKLEEDVSEVQIIVNKFQETDYAFTYKGNAQLDMNETNKYVVNEDIKKRLKIIKHIQIFSWLALIILLITIIALAIIL